MDSKLADLGRRGLLAESHRWTATLRLEAFLRHSRLMTELQRAGRDLRARGPRTRP